MFGNATALEGLHVTGKYRDRSMQHTCSRHAAWDPHMWFERVWETDQAPPGAIDLVSAHLHTGQRRHVLILQAVVLGL